MGIAPPAIGDIALKTFPFFLLLESPIGKILNLFGSNIVYIQDLETGLSLVYPTLK
jgi:hypothetical protein